MSTQLDVDIAALVGEMEAPPCEGAEHGERMDNHDDGPAKFYVRLTCEKCGKCIVKAYCYKFTVAVQQPTRLLICPCGHKRESTTAATVLGPVNA